MFVSVRHCCEMDFLRNLPEPFLIATIHQLYSNHSGGVKDPRPETKDKDTKKIRGQGQGQPFREQILSRSKTEMLQAKAKDQEHRRKCSQKKNIKIFNKFFRRSQKNGLQKFFSGKKGL